MNKVRSFFGRLSHSPILYLAGVTLTMLTALAWSSLAFCDEIHEAAKSGDLPKIKVLLKDHPDSVSSKDNDGYTALQLIEAIYGHKDVDEITAG